MSPDRPNYSVQVIERAAQLLRAFTPEEPSQSIADLSSKLNLHRSTVHRILSALEREGLVEKDPESRRYRLGFILFELGNVVQSHMDLRNQANPFLQQAVRETGESAYIAIERGGQAVYVDRMESSRSVAARAGIGWHAPLHCTALGKVLLAHMGPERVNEILHNHGLERQTANTITDREALLSHLEEVRRSGFALDNEEVEEGLSCVAAPIWDRTGQVVAAMSLAAPAARMTPERQVELGNMLIRITREISRRLGYSPASDSLSAANDLAVAAADQA